MARGSGPDRLWFGGDYNPEQWPEEVLDEDIELMLRAGVTVVTIGVFSWARFEPSEGHFDFEWFDRVINRLHSAGIKIDLATATASPPPWVAHTYPDSLPITETGVRLSIGSRQQYSPHSATYRRLAGRLVSELATRYGSHPAVISWHINNEYGCHVSRCYSDEGAAAFRTWLQTRHGGIEQLNNAWGTSFWSQHYQSFEEIEPPRAAPTARNPAQLLDFDRFSSDALRECLRAEADIIRRLSPGIPITTNFMGTFKPIDYWSWADDLDFISDDSYPDPADPSSSAFAALTRDLMRSLRRGQSWMLMEQATSAVNWRPQNAVKPPGINRLLTLQAIARGSDGAMYFQWRQSTFGAEKFHSAMLPHFGPDSRIYREVEQLGSELGSMNGISGSRVPASVAIVFDWPSWWALEERGVPTKISYVEKVFDWYRAFYEASITIDFVQAEADLSAYSVVIVPLAMVLSEKAIETFARFAEEGGSLVVTFCSALLDERLHVTRGGYLGQLQATLGVTIEELAPLAHPNQWGQAPSGDPTTRISGPLLSDGEVSLWSEYIHADDAEIMATFMDGDMSGWPAITRRRSGAAGAWYIASHPGPEVLDALISRLVDDTNIQPVLDHPVAMVEAVRRGDLIFILNHGNTVAEASVRGRKVMVAARDVLVISGAVTHTADGH
jgi:beta-galactosidase